MRHNLVRGVAVIALATSLPGCFDSHGTDADGGPPPGDGGSLLRSCEEARFAPEGAPCDFDETCPGLSTDCGPPTSIRCVDGHLRTAWPICTRAPARNCMEYLAWSYPGDFCLPDFEGCTIDLGDCCARTIACEAGAITDRTSCGDCDPGVCPGYAPPPPDLPSCTSTDACDPGETCVPVGTPRGCGICFEPTRECELDSDCAGGVCAESTHPCSCGGAASACVADCRTAESDPCGEGARCEDDGHCRALACADGFACSPNTRCAPSAAGADAHGCARIPCAVAADCDCGVCMDGLCQDGPGQCALPVP